MKIDFLDEKIILYIKKDMITYLDFDNVEALEVYFKDLIVKLHDIYNINISGFYNIYVYVDDIYGIVLELEKEDLDYYVGINQVEMRIVKENEIFLYKVTDPIKIKNTNLIKKNNKYYLKINNKIKLSDYLFILENSEIIYSKTDNIIKNGLVIKSINFKKNMI